MPGYFKGSVVLVLVSSELNDAKVAVPSPAASATRQPKLTPLFIVTQLEHYDYAGSITPRTGLCASRACGTDMGQHPPDRGLAGFSGAVPVRAAGAGVL